jgi:hypothetical protein
MCVWQVYATVALVTVTALSNDDVVSVDENTSVSVQPHYGIIVILILLFTSARKITMKLRSSASKRIETWKAEVSYLPASEPGSFPLMRLPLELRVKVYEEALVSEEAFWIYRSTPVPPKASAMGSILNGLR